MSSDHEDPSSQTHRGLRAYPLHGRPRYIFTRGVIPKREEAAIETAPSCSSHMITKTGATPTSPRSNICGKSPVVRCCSRELLNSCCTLAQTHARHLPRRNTQDTPNAYTVRAVHTLRTPCKKGMRTTHETQPAPSTQPAGGPRSVVSVPRRGFSQTCTGGNMLCFSNCGVGAPRSVACGCHTQAEERREEAEHVMSIAVVAHVTRCLNSDTLTQDSAKTFVATCGHQEKSGHQVWRCQGGQRPAMCPRHSENGPAHFGRHCTTRVP